MGCAATDCPVTGRRETKEDAKKLAIFLKMARVPHKLIVGKGDRLPSASIS
jgi:hypothetical protein